MAVYQFSALSDGQSISFDPTVDRLNFDQTTIAAGDLTLVREGADMRVVVKSGPVAGKDIVLLSTDDTELTRTNVTFADGSLFLAGDNAPTNISDHASNVLTGGTGRDLILGLGGNDTLNGGDNNDSLVGSFGNDAVNGNSGNDWLEGNAGNDTLTGSGGQDAFILADMGAANADLLADFASNWDNIQLDAAAFSAIGATGRFAAGDARFFAGTAAHDADDRIIYNSATGQIFYDADGNGAGAAQLIATLPAGRGVVAGDFNVFGSPGSGGGGGTNGTAGDDSLIGTTGNDSINGLGGNDTIDGREGNDTLDGGAGNDLLNGYDGADLMRGGDGDDTLIGHLGSEPHPGPNESSSAPRVDTMEGGLGNDVYRTHGEDVIVDTGGIDTVETFDTDYTLGAGLENLRIRHGDSDGGFDGTGNGLNNVLDSSGMEFGGTLSGLGGDDTLIGAQHDTVLVGGDGNDSLQGATVGSDTLLGGAGNDVLVGIDFGDPSFGDFDVLNGGAGNDTITGGGWFVFDVAPGAANADVLTDFSSGIDTVQLDGSVFTNVGFTGRFTAGDTRFHSAAGANSAHDADDRIVYNTSTGQLWYDSDGIGGAGAQLIATLVSAPSFSASDIEVVNSPGLVINGTGGNDALVGTTSDDTLSGFGGNDTLDGNLGADSMVGGTGNDLYFVENAGDRVVELNNEGIDEVRSSLNTYTLTDFVNNLTLVGNQAFAGTGNEIDNVLNGNALDNTLLGGAGNDTVDGDDGNDWLEGNDGNDSMIGGAGNDLLQGFGGNDTALGGDGNDVFSSSNFGASWGNDVVDGGAGVDWIEFDFSTPGGVVVNLANGTVTSSLGNVSVANVESVQATNGNDFLTGDSGNNSLIGFHGADTFDGGAGNDWLGQSTSEPEGSADTFLFTVAPGAANADLITEWETGLDRIRLDATAMPALGASGQFSSTDARFWAAAGANAGHDADDRVVYNTSTGQLWYDADGSGAGAAQLLFTIAGARPVVATNIWVDNGAAGGQTINGTAGNDSLVGGAGDDTINAFAGNDTIDGAGGVDVMDGGAGNDLYRVDNSADAIVEAENAGIDTVHSTADHYQLAAFVNNLVLMEGALTGAGNEIDNILSATTDHGVELDGFNGNDSLFGSVHNDELNGGAGNDSMAGGAGNDIFDGFNHLDGEVDTMDGGVGDDTFFVSAGDVVIGGDGTDTVWAMISWTLGADVENLVLHTGTDDHDLVGVTAIGNALNNVINAGFDVVDSTFDGKAGNDTLIGGGANVDFLFSVAPGAANADVIQNFDVGSNKIVLDGAVHANSGPSGVFAFDDARFFAGASAHDADDRVIFDGTTLWYDSDGTGAAAQQAIASIQGTLPLSASNIEIVNGGSGGGGGPGSTIIGTSGNDSLNGTAGNDSINGGSGNDSLAGAGGNDTLTGSGGQDTFIFREFGAADADRMTDFATNWDRIQVDDAAFTAAGAAGRLASGDGRFFAGAGASAGHDADDRFVFNTSTGQLYYDADGSGAGAAQLVATVQAGAGIAATDITVI